MCLLSRLDITISFPLYSFNTMTLLWKVNASSSALCCKKALKITTYKFVTLKASFCNLSKISLFISYIIKHPSVQSRAVLESLHSTVYPDTSGLNHLSTLHAADHSILFVVCQNRALRTEAFFPEPLLPLLVQTVHVLRGDITEVQSCLMHFLYYQRLLTTVL